MRVRATSVVMTAIILLVTASTSWAQIERSTFAVTLGGSFGDGGPAPAIGVAGGFRLASRAALDIEVLYTPQQEFTSRFGAAPQPSPSAVGPAVRAVTGRTVAFLASYVTKFESGRLRPFARFGGGIGNIGYTSEQTSGVTNGSNPPLTLPVVIVRSSENVLALIAGGGVDYRLRPRLGLGLDIGYLRLFQRSDAIARATHNMRVGARLEVQW